MREGRRCTRHKLTDRIEHIQAVQQICRERLRGVQALLDPSCGSHAHKYVSGESNSGADAHGPMSASFTPRSAPLSPFPRKGSITPGESYAYTSGLSDSFRRVEITRVIPGCADVFSAFVVAVKHRRQDE